jgi:hypothetical protein
MAAEIGQILGVSSRGDTTAVDPENFIGGDRRQPCAHLDRTRLQKGIVLAHHPPIARYLCTIAEAQRRLSMAHVWGSSPLRNFILCRCHEFDADTFDSGDRSSNEGQPPARKFCRQRSLTVGVAATPYGPPLWA